MSSRKNKVAQVEPSVAPINSVPFRVTVFLNVRISLFACVTVTLPLIVMPSKIAEPTTAMFAAPVSVIVPPLMVPFSDNVRVESFNEIVFASNEV